MSRLALRALLAIAALAFAASVNAQQAGAQSQQLNDLRDALHLTAAQQAAWRDFAAASAPDAERDARERSAEEMLPKLPAPRRVDLSIAVAKSDLESLERRGAALKAFYAQLTPAQQAIFDRETAQRER